MSKMADKLTDLDYAIMAILPDEGARLGHHTYAKQAVTIAEELGNVTSSQLNGRLRSLKHLGLVRSAVVPPVASGLGWQITPDGRQVMTERRGNQQLATVHQLPSARRAGNGTR